MRSSAVRPWPASPRHSEPSAELHRAAAALDRPFRLLRRALLGIRPDAVSFDCRDFRWTDDRTRTYLERVGQTFVRGYHAALDDDRLDRMTRRLDTIEPAWRGFAFEGAAMALVILDRLAPWRASRFRAFLAGPGEPHEYMLRVGAGWALARLRRPLAGPLTRDDSLLGWLVADGYGFHEAYFHTTSVVAHQVAPDRVSGYARRVFDQGLGRALWFINGADPTLVADAVAGFPASRQPDLWSGIGLACAYAGGVDPSGIAAIRRAADSFVSELAQGAAFAAEARAHAENMVPHTEFACRLLTGRSALQAASVVRQARLDLQPDAREPAYEVWRRRIRHHFQEEVATG